MASIVALDRDRVGQLQWVRGRRLDASIDFLTTPERFFSVWLMVPASPGALTRVYYRVPTFRFIDSDRIEFQIPVVGPPPNALPAGPYDVVFRVGFWEGRGDTTLRVGLTPTPAATLLIYPVVSALRRLQASLTLAINTLLFPLQLLFSARARIAFQAFRQAGLQRALFFAMPEPPPAQISVEPIIDAQDMFVAIERLIREAEHFVFAAFWCCDEHTSLSPEGQRRPLTHAVNTDRTFERVLKEHIHARAGNPLDVKVLLWEPDGTPDRDLFAPGFSDVGDLPVLRRRWGDLRTGSFADFETDVRAAPPTDVGSGASTSLLREFYDAYLGRATTTDTLPFPSGIQVSMEEHPTIFGSHHQKFIVTDKGAYIGGMNLTRGDWDAPAHLVADPRREPRPPSSSGSGASLRHDIGTVVRGPLVADVLRLFALRWDRAVDDSGAFTPLVDSLPSGYGDLEDQLEDSQRADVRLVPDELDRLKRLIDPRVDLNHLVDSASISATLPRGTAWAINRGHTDIDERYERAVELLSSPESFLYVESQYFTDVDFTRRVLSRWLRNVSVPGADGRPRAWREYPFAFIVVTYKPDPFVDITSFSGPQTTFGEIAYFEMQCLKWLEVRTARVIYKQNAQGEWYAECGVQYPQSDLHINGDAHDDPRKFDEDSTFTVDRAIIVDPATGAWQYSAGNTEPDRHRDPLHFDVDEVMTDSDIMAYALASNTRYAAMPITATGPDPKSRLRRYMVEHEIYNHSKCSFFIEPADGVHRATAGSANITPRSLDDLGTQDSELNVWWSGNDQIEAFRKRLWAHHLKMANPDDADYNGWKSQAWSDYVAIRDGRAASGNVIRLDVIDRADHLNRVPFI